MEKLRTWMDQYLMLILSLSGAITLAVGYFIPLPSISWRLTLSSMVLVLAVVILYMAQANEELQKNLLRLSSKLLAVGIGLWAWPELRAFIESGSRFEVGIKIYIMISAMIGLDYLYVLSTKKPRVILAQIFWLMVIIGFVIGMIAVFIFHATATFR